MVASCASLGQLREELYKSEITSNSISLTVLRTIIITNRYNHAISHHWDIGDNNSKRRGNSKWGLVGKLSRSE
jgi:hypothetical protein